MLFGSCKVIKLYFLLDPRKYDAFTKLCIPTKKNKTPRPNPIRLNACVFASSSISGFEPLTDIEKPSAILDRPIKLNPIQIGS